MNGAGDMTAAAAAAAAAGNLESSGYYDNPQLKEHFDIGASSGKAISGNIMSESNYNYVIAPDFSANSNPAFVEDDEGALEEGERPSVYPILDGRGSRGQGVAPLSSAQPHGLTNEMVIKYVKAADYEELPHHTSAAGIQDEMSGYTHIDDGSVVVGAGSFHRSGGGGAVAIPDGKQHLVSPKKGIDVKTRRRSNPLYDFPVTRFPVSEYPRGTQGPCGSSWVCCAFHTLVFLLAVAALVLAIINIVNGVGGGQNDMNRGNSSDANSVMQELLWSNSQLQKTIVDLQFKVQSLETAIQWQNGFRQNLSSQVDSQTKQMSRLDAEIIMNLTNAVDFMKKDLSYQISQVPRGLVNLTSCGHHLESTGTTVRQTLTTTNSLNLNGSAVLSVVCSTDGGTQALLRSDRNSLNVYSCECSGQTNSSIVSRYCIIHYWICPILP